MNEDIKRIVNYKKILINLHGTRNLSEQKIIETIADDGGYSKEYVRGILELASVQKELNQPRYTKEYGLILGRFQPLHYGHQHIINEVILAGKVPIILLGDDGGNNLVRNPLTVGQRTDLIKLIYPNTEIIFLSVRDNENWTDWFDDIGHALVGKSGRVKEQITLYFNNKEIDRYDHFEVNGSEYYNEFYTQVFEDNGIKTQQVEFVERNDIVIEADATNIRENFEDFKHLLDGRVYWQLKDWGWK